MSIAAITAGSSQLCALQHQYQQVRSQFKQLGQHLQGGNLTKAQSDFVTLSQAAASQLGGSSAIAQALNSVGQSLQSGDLSGAQQAFSSLTKVGPCAVPQHSHVPPMGGKLSEGLEQLVRRCSRATCRPHNRRLQPFSNCGNSYPAPVRHRPVLRRSPRRRPASMSKRLWNHRAITQPRCVVVAG
jgi:hypothetical protein